MANINTSTTYKSDKKNRKYGKQEEVYNTKIEARTRKEAEEIVRAEIEQNMTKDDYAQAINVDTIEFIDGVNESTMTQQHPSQMPMRRASPVEYSFTFKSYENKNQHLDVNQTGECAIEYLSSIPEYKFSRDFLIDRANQKYNSNSYNNTENINLNIIISNNNIENVDKYLDLMCKLRKETVNPFLVKNERQYILNFIKEIKAHIYNIDNNVHAPFEAEEKVNKINGFFQYTHIKLNDITVPDISVLDITVPDIELTTTSKDEVTQIIPGKWNSKQGLTPAFIHELCVEHDISHYVMDITRNCFLKYVSINRNKPALMYYAINNHMYLVKESDRKSIN